FRSTASDMHADLLLLQGGKSVKRLRLVERRLMLLGKVSVVISALLFLAAFAYFGAVKQTRRADKEKLRAERAEQDLARQLYRSDMNLAQQSWDKGNVRQAIEWLLEAHRIGKAHREDL